MDLLKKIPDKKLRDYINKRIQRIEGFGYRIVLIDKQRIIEGKSTYGGLFDEENKELTVAIGGEYLQWIPIFIHETCHLDQTIEKCEAWQNIQNCYRDDCAVTVFFRWLDDKKKYSDDIVFKAISATRDYELDCEMRVAKEIINNKLDKILDLSLINKQANAYIYFYNVMYFTRKWYSKNFRSNKVKKLWKMMPDHFDNDYTMLPIDYYRQCLKHCYKKKK